MASITIVASKEFSDIIRSKRFVALLSVFALLMVASIANTYISATQGVAAPAAMPRGFLLLVASSLISMMAYFAPILGISLGVDAVSGERERGTLKMVLVQPVFRDTFINGKFLGTIAAISLALSVASLINVAGSVVALGITPTVEDGARLLAFLALSILYTVAYYGIAVLLSTVSRRTAVSVIASVMIWAVFTFVVPIVASMIAFSAVPIRIQPRPGQNMTITITPELREELMRRAAIVETVSMFTPNYHFNRAAGYILQASVRVGVTGIPGQAARQIPLERAVSIAESLAYAWPNILVLAMVAAFTLVVTYMIFVRQETR